MRNILLTAFIAATLGLLLGSSQPASAGSSIAIVIMPPTLNTGQSPELTTGYHSTPPALDWDDNDPSNIKVFIRTFGIAPYSTPTNIALAVGTDTSDDNPCYTTLVTFYEATTWVTRGKIKWWHTRPLSENIYGIIQGDDTWAHLDDEHLSDTVSTFKCRSTGPHVHETFEMVNNRNTGLYPTVATCNAPYVTTDCDTFQNNDIANWTMNVIW